MPKIDPLNRGKRVGDVNYHQHVSVDTDALVAHYQLLVQQFVISKHENVGVPDFQIVFYFHYEFVLHRVVLAKFDNVEPVITLKLICKNVKVLVIRIIAYLFYSTDAVN